MTNKSSFAKLIDKAACKKSARPFFASCLAGAIVCFTILPAVASSDNKMGTPLPVEQEAKLKKANRLANSGKAGKAAEKYCAALETAENTDQCLAIAEASERMGAPLMDVRRVCLKKGIQLAKAREDYFHVAIKARQYQFYEITRSAFDYLIASATTNEELFALAEKSQTLALNDLAHMAMEKAYSQTKTVTDGLTFAKAAKLLNMDDLLRKAIKDLIEDESSAVGLCQLLNEIDRYQMADLDRYLLKRAVYSVKNVYDCKTVFEMAKRYGQDDIVNLAAFRGRKMIMMQQMAENQQAQAAQQGQAPPPSNPQALEAQEQKAANDMARRYHNYDNGPGF
jgi:hypothetical protein